MRRTVYGVLSLLMFATAVVAQTSTWTEDMETAKTKAEETGKYILLNFAGSDWCVWCIRLNDEVFSQDAFKTYADETLIPVLLDFPRSKQMDQSIVQQNRALQRKYGIQGFPTVILLSPQGDVVAKTGYQFGGAEKYVEHLKGLIDTYEKQQKS